MILQILTVIAMIGIVTVYCYEILKTVYTQDTRHTQKKRYTNLTGARVVSDPDLIVTLGKYKMSDDGLEWEYEEE